MVSFSCDHCQNVFTRARIDRHFLSCRTHSVSCIDCGTVFDSYTVKQHTSCITEAEKYEGRGRPHQSSKSYCTICNLDIPGLVAAEQHYQSKKHRANERRQKANANAEKASKIGTNSEPSQDVRAAGMKNNQTLQHTEKLKDSSTPVGSNPTAEQSNGVRELSASNEAKSLKNRELKVKRTMKKLLRVTPKQRMRKQKLVGAVADSLQDNPHDELTILIMHLATKSRRFTTGKYIELVPKKP